MSGIYNRQYIQGIEWENAPSEDTPLDAEHLRVLDGGINRVDTEVSAAMQYLYNKIKDKGWA